jgi:hypothetical protein
MADGIKDPWRWDCQILNQTGRVVASAIIADHAR